MKTPSRRQNSHGCLGISEYAHTVRIILYRDIIKAYRRSIAPPRHTIGATKPHVDAAIYISTFAVSSR